MTNKAALRAFEDRSEDILILAPRDRADIAEALITAAADLEHDALCAVANQQWNLAAMIKRRAAGFRFLRAQVDQANEIRG